MNSLQSSLLLLSLLLCSQTGCISLSRLLGESRKPTIDLAMLSAQGIRIPPGGMPSSLPENVQLEPHQFVLELRGSEKKLAAISLDPERAMTVEELAAKAEMPDTFGRTKIYIMRPTQGGSSLRLDSALDSKGKCLDPGKNYALRPGDHVIAMGDGRSLFERFVDEKLGRE
jgi:hypothetical protein